MMRIADKRNIIKGRLAAGKALRIREAYSRSAWTGGYGRAIEEARKGNPEYLIDLFIARRPLQDDEYDLMAELVAGLFRKQGGRANQAAHQAAVLARTLKSVGFNPTDERLSALCKMIGRQCGEPVSPDAVRTLLRNPKRLQQE